MRLDDMVYAAVFVIAVVGFSTAGYQLGNKRGHERGVQESLGITARSVDCARAGVTMGFIEATEALGLDLANMSKDLRSRYKIKDSVKGVVITSVDGNSDAADKRLSAGEVIVEVAQEAVTNAADIKKRVDQLKKDGKKSVLLLVANSEGELRFVALALQ